MDTFPLLVFARRQLEQILRGLCAAQKGTPIDVFDLRERLVTDYADYTRSFVVIRDSEIAARVDRELEEGLLWPDPIVQHVPQARCLLTRRRRAGRRAGRPRGERTWQ